MKKHPDMPIAGDSVHYFSPRATRRDLVPRAAIVTEVRQPLVVSERSEDAERVLGESRVALVVFWADGHQTVELTVRYAKTPTPGCWSWRKP